MDPQLSGPLNAAAYGILYAGSNCVHQICYTTPLQTPSPKIFRLNPCVQPINREIQLHYYDKYLNLITYEWACPFLHLLRVLDEYN